MISLNKDMIVFQGRQGVSGRKPQHDAASMAVEEWTFEPGVLFDGHAHKESQIAYVIKGRMKLKQDEKEIEVETGCYYYTPANTVHQIIEIIEPTTLLIVSTPKQ
ncbi:MAG: cupin domain-containing protein [Desulfobulbaceae bacterium]|nr:cupin domain-containing protein [Desulfobulbaceae bacterium]